MTANQCRRPFLPTPTIGEDFSLCTLRIDAQQGSNVFLETITTCCKTAPIKRDFCWNYCAVEESQFSTWFACIEAIMPGTRDAACQRTDRSIVTYASTTSKTSTTTSSKTTTSSTSTAAPTAETRSNSDSAGRVNSRGTETLPTSGSNGTNATGGAPRPTDYVQAGTSKAFILSTGGMMCAFLALSALSL
ncbi:uncharacterized protein RCO7_01531 [Rhynchosporium graminicola]|uniref:Uncharacterized protein n=1 Tax=Rhynchosporium graminicola TaxID=2792576 RepID=A0A1E1JZI5_9HELO|nr:uncharacterized protein RCO7_01531 [Rhynchosporium commune]